jgi:hypothetical protein
MNKITEITSFDMTNDDIYCINNIVYDLKKLEIGVNIITLCGSTKFKQCFELTARELTLAGYIILQPGCFAHADGIHITDKQKIDLDVLHKEKIDMADAVVFLNSQHYMGDSTKSELQYSIDRKKPIVMLHNVITNANCK